MTPDPTECPRCRHLRDGHRVDPFRRGAGDEWPGCTACGCPLSPEQIDAVWHWGGGRL